MSIQVEKCLITDDPRLPLLKVIGELPAIDIKIAGKCIINVNLYVIQFISESINYKYILCLTNCLI